MIRFHAIIHGHVQGVFYRAWTQKHASSLGLTGWVRNLPNGDVELIAEGPQPKLEELRRFCEQGPPSSRVERVDETWAEATGEFKDFTIQR